MSAPHWYGHNAGADRVPLCPTDNAFAAGTYEARLYGYSRANMSAVVSSFGKKGTLRGACLEALPSPQRIYFCFSVVPRDAAPTIACNSAMHTCLSSDMDMRVSLPATSSSRSFYFAFPISGPCPRLFGFYHVNSDPGAYSIITISTVFPFPDYHNVTQLSELIVLEDFLAHRISLSFCPADVAVPTVVCIFLALRY